MTREERIERCLRGIANDGCGDMDSHNRTCRDRSDDPSAWCWCCVAAAEIESIDAAPASRTEETPRGVLVVGPDGICRCGHRGDEHVFGFECERCSCNDFVEAAARETAPNGSNEEG